MSRHSANPAIATLDPVWDRIRTEAEEAAHRDPSLGGFFYATVLNHGRFEEALAQRLVTRLKDGDVGESLLAQATAEAFDSDPELGAAARADIVATHDRDPACHRYLDPLLYFKGFHAIQTHRVAHWLWTNGRKDFAYLLQSRASRAWSVDIHPATRMGKGIFVDHAHDIVIGETAVLEDNVSIMQGVTLGGTGKVSGDRHPKIRHGVLVGAGAKVLGNIEIGHCSRVAACSVVLHDVPPNRTVAGIPAKIVGSAGCEEPARAMDHQLADPQ